MVAANPWQYAALVEGLFALGTAIGVARASMQSARHVDAYAHFGVTLIVLGLMAALAQAVGSAPNVVTGLAFGGFTSYICGGVLLHRSITPFRKAERQ